jgi:hypothetical protein
MEEINMMDWFVIAVLSAIVFFILFVFTWVVFGKLMTHQIKRWILASKGYVEVEHISPTKVRNYFIMKPSDNKFDLSEGFFHYIPECVSKTGDIISKVDEGFFSKAPDIKPEDLEGLSDKEKEAYKKKVLAEWEEAKKLYKSINDLKYDPQLLNRKLGMPIITYYGDNPDPMNPAERDKVYGSGVIRDMFLRLLLTQRFKDFQRVIMIGLIIAGIIAIALVALYYNQQSIVKINQACNSALIDSNTRYLDMLNKTLVAKAQGSTIVVG